jgi:hypothetical protein
MTKARYTIPRNRYSTLEFRSIAVIDAAGMGLSLADVFAPNAFSKDERLGGKGEIIRIEATDGRCWATVTGINDYGNVVIELDAQPATAAPTATPATAAPTATPATATPIATPATPAPTNEARPRRAAAA